MRFSAAPANRAITEPGGRTAMALEHDRITDAMAEESMQPVSDVSQNEMR